MKTLFLGIDVGTSGCKIAVFDGDGALQSSVTESYVSHYPAPGWVEQNPDDWWKAICTGLSRLWQQGVDPSQIAAIGVDGQGWSAIPLNVSGEVLAPTPIWMDTRAADICETYRDRIGADRLFGVSGNPFAPTYTLPKVLYWMEREPALIAEAAHILQSNSFVVYRLTDAITMDYSMAYGWQNFDLTHLRFDRELTKDLSVPERFLTEPMPSHAIAGHVSAEAARHTGLVEGTPVVAGGLDAACSTLGAGVVESGQTQEQGGQAGGMSICMDAPVSHPSLILGAHVVPGKWLLQGGTVGGGAGLKWFAEQIACQGGTQKQGVFVDLSATAERSTAGSNGLLFLPYLAGERSPLWDPKAQGMYFGLKFSTSYSDLVRATMEGVAFALRHNIEVAQTAGAQISALYGTGGSANSRIWTQIKADITGIPMIIPASDTATTCGAAMLAMVGVGHYGNFADAVNNIVHIERAQEPDSSCAELYGRMFAIYKQLYTQTASSMAALSDVVR